MNADSRRFTVSAHATDSTLMPNAIFEDWFAGQCAANRYQVDLIAFDQLDGWHFQESTGNLVHRSGRFFSVEGLEVRTGAADRGEWMQPIINQPEIGVLGILVKEFDGVLHCLLQAKMEPGNINTVQLSPTVQATRSNYTGVHRGRPIPYLDYFTARRGRVLVDSLQSEQGAWFLRKRNRNMVVEVLDDIEPLDGFCWLTIGQVHRMLLRDNLVNMDTRTVLACVPFQAPNGAPRIPCDDGYRDALMASVSGQGRAQHSTAEILSWLTDVKATRELVQHGMPLRDVKRWHRTADRIEHEDGKYFAVIAAEVSATNREVSHWTQPMLAPVERGLAGWLARPFGGVLHLLVQAKTEAGVFDTAELAPTVQCMPGAAAQLPERLRPRFLDAVCAADSGSVRYDVVQSEEGGRFFHADSRYRIVEVGDDFPEQVAPQFRWVTVFQLTELLNHSNYVNIQTRSLLAGLHTTW